MYSLNICHLYPDLLNMYGDRGNIITLQKRCDWRGIEVVLHNISLSDSFQPNECDILFLGGGQDFEQEIIMSDFLEKSELIRDYTEDDGVILAICGGYQMLGKYYKTGDGKTIELPGIIDIETIASKERLIGNIVFEWENDITKEVHKIIGFENHSGLTYLGEGVKPLGTVVKGFGNNGKDHTEGARYKNVFCSYSHGSLLPKNPAFADYIITCALKRKYKDAQGLTLLEDLEELQANQAMIKRILG